MTPVSSGPALRPDASRASRIELEGSGALRLVADAYGPIEGRPVLFLHGGGVRRFVAALGR